ncbi:hypothetical protein KIF59_03275 [Enterobacter cloacae subsp. cloacae]|nr:hypothetical protein [Enterobacter cloacae subsp. cloacae]
MAVFRIGWVAAGKHARRIQQLQLMSTLSTSSAAGAGGLPRDQTLRRPSSPPATYAGRA